MAESFDVVFHGNSKSECIGFIRAVRKYAKQNKKMKDNQWIADELYDAFDGEPLLWYVRLPADVQGDWGRLQEALVTRWTMDEGEEDISKGVSSLAILPTAAAAPPIRPSSGTPPRDNWEGKIGRIRVQTNGMEGVRYLSKNLHKGGQWWSGAFDITADMTLALKVRPVISASGSYRLELVEHESKLSVLAPFNILRNDWSQCSWGILVGVDAPGQGSLKDRRSTYDNGPDGFRVHQFWTETWQIESTGLLKLRGPANSTEVARFARSDEDRYRDTLWFLGPEASMFSRVETSLEFEPIDN